MWCQVRCVYWRCDRHSYRVLDRDILFCSVLLRSVGAVNAFRFCGHSLRRHYLGTVVLWSLPQRLVTTVE